MGKVSRLWLVGAVVASSLFFAAPVGAVSIGELAATLAASRMGSAYVSGMPVRPGLNYADADEFDCSGLVWWVAERVTGVAWPYYVAADQATVGERLTSSPWSGELPVGALLFLADPNQGAGITHVSIHLGNNIAADCYNDTDDCLAHDVSQDNYYFKYWAFATYPWGDAPSYASGGAGVQPGSGSGAGSDAGVAGSIYTAGQGGGAIRQSLVTPIAQFTAAGDSLVAVAATQVAGHDPGELAASQMAPVSTMVGNLKAVDGVLPLHVLTLVSALLVVLVLRFVFSGIRYIVDLLPG